MGAYVSTVKRRLQSVATCIFASAIAASLVACSNSSSTTTPTTSVSALSGSYVFTANGTDPNDGLYDVAGVLTFDGKGGITSGIADYNFGSGVDSNVPLTGSYAMAGSTLLVTLTDGQNAQDSFTVNMASAGSTSSSSITNFDGSGTGTLAPQASLSSFATSGTYTYTLSGFGENTLASTGGFTVASGTITSGTQDITDGVVVTDYATISGVVEPVQSNGRGQASFNGYTFSYYPVSASSIVLVGLDDRSLVYGTAQKM
jgi:hypothetical protein